MEVRGSKNGVVVAVIIILIWGIWGGRAQTVSVSFQYRSSTKWPAGKAGKKTAGAGAGEEGKGAVAVEFLRAHNEVRRRVGEPLLEWNRTLEAYAGEWAKKRVKDCRLLHSNGAFGENIFWGGRNHWRPSQVVRIWADEYKYYDVHANSCLPNHMCGHYTQIVWRDSRMLGCARQDCSNGGVFFICVYNPPGNFEGENPFGLYLHHSSASRSDPPPALPNPSSL